jgi:Uma2 family endonuclease
VKAALYAEAGVPEYWVLDLIDRELIVLRSAHEGVYRICASHQASDRVSPEAWPDVVLDVATLFPADEPS